ncbi:hypothetical protein [Flavobacterium sp.]|uniref:hypothetical protein n=1 Tax=Flavobacterium sp. TaxID=239 RepID=UPI0031D00C01
MFSVNDEFVHTADDQKINNRNFLKTKFQNFNIGPGIPWDKKEFDPYPWLKKTEITNSSFINCQTNGECAIRGGVSVKNVIIESMKCSDVLTISTNALLDNLVIKGKMDLWIKPDEPAQQGSKKNDYQNRIANWLSESQKEINCFLDIRDLEAGEVDIYGIPIEKIKYNPEKMIPIYSKWNKEIDWTSSKFHVGSYWKIRVRQLSTYNVTCGLVSMPSKNDKYYAEAMEEFKYLTEIGILDNLHI